MEEKRAEIVEFDIRGQICPSSLLVALREINKNGDRLKEGSLELLFKTDNRDATVTIPESASNMGYGTKVLKHQGYYVITIGRPE